MTDRRSVTLTTTVSVDLAAAMDAWREAQPGDKPTREEAIRLALYDWLAGMGFIRVRDDPEGAN